MWCSHVCTYFLITLIYVSQNSTIPARENPDCAAVAPPSDRSEGLMSARGRQRLLGSPYPVGLISWSFSCWDVYWSHLKAIRECHILFMFIVKSILT